ncbi:MAG: nickel-dependent hydrogenase large subunit [Pseudomonadota bacterium]
MSTITIMDPVTRIEGHMKVEVTIDTLNGQQQIVDARCTGTLFRGFETLLTGRSPLDAPVITQRVCGVCPISHGLTSVLALENVSEWLPPTNARLLRNLTQGANFLQSHILHFYLLAALDYVSGPNASPWKPAWSVDMRSGLDPVAANLGKALEARRRAHEMGAVFGGKMPGSHAYIPGGFTATATSGRISQFKAHLIALTDFIRNVYIPDVNKVATVYADYFNLGAGCKNLLAFGVFQMDDFNQDKLLAPGYVKNAGTSVSKLDPNQISESVAYSWYADRTDNLAPSAGATEPLYPKGDAYSWLKAPRLSKDPYEAGPLARMWINGDYRRGISIMDRHAARAQEALKVAVAMQEWLNILAPGEMSYDKVFDQHSGVGIGMSEAPRGALGHWVKIVSGKISQYQIITPTCWNASPRDGMNVPGPMEQALIGTPVKDPAQPIEALRVIHAFDPCLSCAVHVMRPEGKPTVVWDGKN